jgi:hypothetical protein
MKIFIGTYNIASQLNDWKYGFEHNDCYVRIGSYGSHTELVSGDYDYLLKYKEDNKNKFFSFLLSKSDQKRRRQFLKKMVKEFDVFFFVWEGILDDFEDFEIIKHAGKKLIVQFVGDEVRWEPAARQEFEKYQKPIIEYDNYDYSLKELNKKLSYIRKAEKYADLIYSYPNQSQLLLREYGLNNYIINFSDFTNNSIQRKIPKIIHFPSSSSFKGTKYVLNSVDKLRNKLEFEFLTPESMIGYDNQSKAIPYNKIKQVYSDCDILIGQLLCSGGGKQERELLASGKIVLSNMNPAYEKHLPSNNPIIDVNPSNLTTELEKIINDFERRKYLASIAKEYAIEHHNPITITKRILKDLEIGGYNGYKYSPTFFRDDYIPENEHLSLYNEWNSYVKNEVWYKQSVPSKERAGLIF